MIGAGAGGAAVVALLALVLARKCTPSAKVACTKQPGNHVHLKNSTSAAPLGAPPMPQPVVIPTPQPMIVTQQVQMAQPVVAQQQVQMIRGPCGTMNHPGATFCGGCGSPLSAEVVARP